MLSKTGYTFEGWFKNKTGSGEPVKYVYPSSIEPFADITLYAKWKLWTAEISYYDEGTTQNVEYGKPVKLLKHTKKKLHSYFLGWTTEFGATVEMYKEGADFTWKGAADGETVTLYSVWKALPVKVFVESAPPAAKGITDIKLEYVASSHLFRATLEGIDAFTWYVDGKKVDGQNLSTLSVSALSVGLHTVMVTAEKDGRLLSQTMVVSIKNAQ